MSRPDLNNSDEELDLDFSMEEENEAYEVYEDNEDNGAGEDIEDIEADEDNIELEDEYNYDEADAAFDKAEKKRAKSSLIRKVILIIAVMVFCYSAYMLTGIFLEYKKGTDAYKEIDNSVINEDSTISVDFGEQEIEIPFTYDHDMLTSINSDAVGYLYLPAIDIRLPFVQTTDNDYYLYRTFNKTDNKAGCLFADCRSIGGANAKNLVIHGHNMKNGSMFGKLQRYKSSGFTMSSNNNYIYVYTGKVIKRYQIFSVHISEPVSDTYTFNFSSDEDLLSYAEKMKSLSLFDTNVDISGVSQVLTLSTCTNSGDQRVVVHASYMDEAIIPEQAD